MLKQSGNVKTSEVIKLLQDAQYKYTSPAGDVLPTAQTGIDNIQKWIDYTLGFGDEMPMSEVQVIKQGLQEAFPRGSKEIVKASQEAVTGASSMVKKFIEETGVEGIENTNKEIILTRFVKEAAIDKLNTQKFKLISNLSDWMMGAYNPGLLLGKKGVELFTSQFDQVAQAKLINEGLQMAAANGDKKALRLLLRFSWRLGVGWGASQFANLPESQPEQPGLDIENVEQ